jgi:site-specific recombinase XerD
MEIKKLLDEYLKYITIYKATATLDYYKRTFKTLSLFFELNNIKLVNQITNNTINDLIIHLKTNHKNYTINKHVAAIHTVLNKFKANNLDKQIKLSSDVTSFKSIDNKELTLIINYLLNVDISINNNLSKVAAVTLMIDSGIRANELLNIESKNVNTSKNEIVLNHTKNKESRTIYYGNLSSKYITLLMSCNNEYLFYNFMKKERLCYSSIQSFLDIITREIKSDINIHPHRFRKTFAQRLYNGGCKLITIQNLLGHKDIKTTMIYLSVSKEELKEDYKKYYNLLH